MLHVTFYRDSHNRLSCIFARGHAGSADFGEDVVCAAVSAILQAARLGLAVHAKVELDVSQHSGNLRMSWPADVRDDPAVRAIVTTAELSVEQIAAQHPSHVKFHRESDRDGTSGPKTG